MLRRTRLVASTWLGQDLKETRQPLWRAHVYNPNGMYNYEQLHLREFSYSGVAPRSPPKSLVTPHPNVLHTNDLYFSRNPHFMGYFNQLDIWHNFFGRKHSSSSHAMDYRDSDTEYDLTTDLRFKGLRPSIVEEPGRNHLIYSPLAGRRYGVNTFFKFSKEKSKSKQAPARNLTEDEVKAWWRQLSLLVQENKAAVGQTSQPGEHCDISRVHKCFVEFQHSITSFQYENRELLSYLKATRPKEFDDLFGVFLEMESNYVNPHYCPRCSMPVNSTTSCGEGDPMSRFRTYRGRLAPHKRWGKEWFEAVANRAEQLWYRSVEDPLFGVERHTQLQADKMMEIYMKTQQRGRANTFLSRLFSSEEYLTGVITFSPAMRKSYDTLLDTTPHPHLATKATKPNADLNLKYLGVSSTNVVPSSPMQIRVDLELAKFRREQKEEGVVRIPPKDWHIDTTKIVPYATTKDGVRNWKEVRAGIEKSFLSTGLPPSAYTAGELREMMWIEDQIATQESRMEKLKSQFLAERTALGANGFVFPDVSYYRCFDITNPNPFSSYNSAFTHGAKIQLRRKAFEDEANVRFRVESTEFDLDVSKEGTQPFGYGSGTKLALTANDGETVEIVVLGVKKSGSPADWTLVGQNLNDADDIVELGKDLRDIRVKWKSTKNLGLSFPASLEAAKTTFETFTGTVVGVLGGILYMQWNREVATPLGTLEYIKNGFEKGGWKMLRDGTDVVTPQEPLSWQTPFRNDWLEERLAELKRAPWTREEHAPLIPHKYTPKPKKFGYSQNDERKDFETKEYNNRLLAKQFYTNPQKFQVLPDQAAPSVRFGGKWDASTRFSGPPTVDRSELDRGWKIAEEVPTEEVEAVEQALRDISGRRPGNAVKPQEERANFKIHEDWFRSFGHADPQFHNEKEGYLLPSERRLIDPSALPFGGMKSPLGGSSGVYERFSWVLSDFSKGFDAFRDGSSATSAPAVELNDKIRTSNLKNDSVIRRMFMTKLKRLSLDIHTFVSTRCQGLEPKSLILALKEWTEAGRPPSPIVLRALKPFLAAEVEAFNKDIPPNKGIPALTLDDSGGNGVISNQNQETILWAEADRTQFKKEMAAMEEHSTAESGYLLNMFIRKSLSASNMTADQQLLAHLRAELTKQFTNAFAEIVGRGLTADTITQISSTGNRSAKAQAYNLQLVHQPAILDVLTKLGFTIDERKLIMAGLSEIPDTQSLADGSLVVRLGNLLDWSGPSASTKHDAKSEALSTIAPSSAYHAAPMPEMLRRLLTTHEGLVLDLKYAAERNIANLALKKEFLRLVRPSCTSDEEADSKYVKYCQGNWVPSVTEMNAMIASLLQRAENDPALLEEMFTTKDKRVTGVKPVEPAAEPFAFDCIKSERAANRKRFRSNGVEIGVDAKEVPFLVPRSDNIQVTTFTGTGYTTTYFDERTAAGLNTELEKTLNPNGTLWNSIIERDLSQFANKILIRCLPLLSTWHEVIFIYQEKHTPKQNRADASHNTLKKIISNEKNSAIEQEFRQNAERYWRNVLEGNNNSDGGNLATGGRPQYGGKRNISNVKAEVPSANLGGGSIDSSKPRAGDSQPAKGSITGLAFKSNRQRPSG